MSSERYSENFEGSNAKLPPEALDVEVPLRVDTEKTPVIEDKLIRPETAKDPSPRLEPTAVRGEHFNVAPGIKEILDSKNDEYPKRETSNTGEALRNFLFTSQEFFDLKAKEKEKPKDTSWTKIKSFFGFGKKVTTEESVGESVELEQDVENQSEKAQIVAEEILIPQNATVEEKKTILDHIKEDWAKTSKTKIMGVAVPDILLGMGTGAGASFAVKTVLRGTLGVSGGIGVGAFTGSMVGGGKTVFLEKRRTNRETDDLLRKKIAENISKKNDLEKLSNIKNRNDRLNAYVELMSEGDSQKKKQAIEEFAGIKIDWKKVSKSALYGALAGAAGAVIAGWLMGHLAERAVEVHQIASVGTHTTEIPEFSKPEIHYTPASIPTEHLNHITSMPVHEVPLTPVTPISSVPIHVEMPLIPEVPMHEIGSLGLSHELGVPEDIYNSIDPSHTTVNEALQKIADASAMYEHVKSALALENLKPGGDELNMTVEDFLKHRMSSVVQP